ncbi:hypothetical protein DFH08DRAFT_335794 [Mycena albidolilacea]|uniref:F-box domain-containing protein n=1 Tax=Mycena albidolilacea TaxID=1033008 RepID=A0AAD6ZKG3_9AGAR|nr:hypothetical protein DFH08DRAFT_335794 [Mycena albidolilacea]
MNDYVGILEQIKRTKARHASYQKEISRLKRILAACPPPGQSVLSTREGKRTFRACKHACCDPSLCPPRASTEMLRLRRIIQQLQIRSREILQDLSLLLPPIRRLPPELLQMVFSFAVPDRFQLPLATRLTISAIQLAHVCSYWRTVALDTSRLWTNIFIPPRHQSSIALLEFYSSHAKTSPLTVHFHRSLARPILRKLLAHMSHRWHDVYLTVENSAFGALEVVRRKVPLLKSLSIYNESERDGTQTNDVFESAPALRRVVLTTSVGHVWPFSFVLPWEQLTSLTLVPISLSVFAECIQNCPHLLYFCASILPRPGEAAQQLAMAEPHHGRGHGTALRKLVVLGAGCQDVLLAHTFPRLRSLSIVLGGPLHPDFPAFLARAPRLEMLAVRGCDPGAASTTDLLVLLLAAPALRILHFRDWHTAVVTPRFDTPLGAPAPAVDDADPCDAVEPQSLAELGVERCAAFDEVELRRLIEMRGERNPYFDPYGIERARLLIEGVPFDAEAELDYLAYR